MIARPAEVPATPTPGSSPRSQLRTISLSSLWRTLDSLAARAGRRWLARQVGRLFRWLIYGSIAVLVGAGSAWYMVDIGTSLTVERSGPWRRWVAAGDPAADPYTRAHFLRAGWLPLAPGNQATYTASIDSSGAALYADCDYALTGSAPAARWWSLSAFDLKGRLIGAQPGRMSLTAADVLPGPAGALAITVGSTTAPGNWLAISGAERMQLVLMVYPLARGGEDLPIGHTDRYVPFSIDRIGCR